MSQARQTFKDRNETKWNYINEKDLHAIFPNGGFKIFSDLHKKGKLDKANTLETEEASIGLYPYKNKLPWMKSVIGYIPIVDENGKEGFIRIIGVECYKVLIPIFVIFLCLSIFTAGIWLVKKSEVSGLDKTAVSFHIKGMKNTDSGTIMLPGLEVLSAKEDETYIKTNLINPDGNGCYFRYSIKLEDTGETLYTSGLIPPGKAVIEFNMKKGLKAGTYPVMVLVETQDLKDASIVYNGGNIEATLEVKKE